MPKGAVTEYKFTESKIYPGTTRSYWIYLPPNFNAESEYPLMIFLDGGGMQNSKGQFRAPIVFDNLIAKKEIPPLVGLFINPGEVPPVAPGARGRSTRSFEYDTPDDACSLDTATRAFSASNHDMRELLVALTQTDAFRFRPQVMP